VLGDTGQLFDSDTILEADGSTDGKRDENLSLLDGHLEQRG